MNNMENQDKTARQLAARLSLRKPQSASLDILAHILAQLEFGKAPDLKHWLQVIQTDFPAMKDFEREFPSLCFALATGVGKTRLMGAMIAWLFLTGRSRHFLVLAPNLTIYEKLKRDFMLGSPKYVFTGIPELAQTPPVIITGDDYTEGRGVRLDYAVPATLSGDLFGAETAPHINIFNISKINAKDNPKGAAKSGVSRVRRFQEYLGDSYFNYLAELPDLVVLMDEAHRYYASAGAKAINDLQPVLGIELTATPKTVGAKPRDFKNIVYHYPLAAALDDGYVKIPAVATRNQAVSSELLVQHLEDNRVVGINRERDETRETRLEDYLVRHLMDWHAVDYDQHANLLYKLAGQMVAHLCGYLGDDAAVENVLLYWRKSLGNFIQAQMQAHIWTTPTDYIGKVTQGFDLLKPMSFTLAAGVRAGFRGGNPPGMSAD